MSLRPAGTYPEDVEGREGYDDERIAWEPPEHLPPDAVRMGLNRAVPDGALLDFAGSLDGSKPLHKVTAWVMLVVFGMPVLGYLWRLADTLWSALTNWPGLTGG